MRRSFVTTMFALALALPTAAFAQQTAQQPPAQQAATQQPPAPATPKLTFSGESGILLVQIKPDQTAAFEELVGKIKAGFAKTEDATLKQQAAGFKVYKAAEPFANNTLYLVMVEPVVAGAEYEMFTMLSKLMTPEELRDPNLAEMWKKFQGAFAAPLGKLNLTKVGG